MSESTNIVLEDGTIKYFNAEGELHRVDGPAVILADGGQEWCQNGRLHREDGPARIWANEYQEWYQNGLPHREDGPAKIWADGRQEWCKNGRLHREDGPAMIWADGEQVWYQNGIPHREDGPALISAHGHQEWWTNGRLHREDGPARIWANGYQEWWLFDIELSEELIKNLDSLTADLIHKEKNTEVRAWLINRMGWVNYLREINAKPIDSRHNHVENTKEALYWINRLQQKQLFVTCPTGRVFNLHLPKHIKTCAEAQSWLGNDVENNYNVIGRT